MGGHLLQLYNGFSDVNINGALTGQRYIDQVINPYIVPFSLEIGSIDNARPHRAIIVRNHLQQAGNQTMDKPSRSPDLRPIENAWDELGVGGGRMNNRANRPAWTSVNLGVERYTTIRHSKACSKNATSLPGSY